MANESVRQLQSVVDKLRSQREAHENAIADIDAAFEQLGVSAPAAQRRGRPGRASKTTRRKRRKFDVSGKESVLRYVQRAPKTGRTGAEIERQWKSEGRSVSAYNALGELVREKKIKRQNIKGQRGSVYRAG